MQLATISCGPWNRFCTGLTVSLCLGLAVCVPLPSPHQAETSFLPLWWWDDGPQPKCLHSVGSFCLGNLPFCSVKVGVHPSVSEDNNTFYSVVPGMCVHEHVCVHLNSCLCMCIYSYCILLCRSKSAGLASVQNYSSPDRVLSRVQPFSNPCTKLLWGG